MNLRGRGRINRGRGRGRGRGRRGRGRGRGRGRSGGNDGSRSDGFRSRFLHCPSCANAQGFNPNQVSELRMPLGTLSATNHYCPICNYQVLNVRNEETQKDHTVCPYCFNHPPQDQISGENTFSNGFRCFQCKKRGCTLAGGAGGGGGGASVAPCQKCNNGGEMVLKFVPKLGKPTVGCTKWSDGCKNTIWFPSFVKQDGTKVSAERCARCNAMKIDLVFDLRSAPPGTAPNHTGCVMPHCDRFWCELMDYDRQSRGFGYGGGGGGGGGGRGNNSGNRGGGGNANRRGNSNPSGARNAVNRSRTNSRNIGSGRLVQSRINARPSNGQGYLVDRNNRGIHNNARGGRAGNSNNNNNNSGNGANGSNAFSFMMDNSRGKGKGRGKGRGRKKATKSKPRAKKGKGRGRGRGRGKRK